MGIIVLKAALDTWLACLNHFPLFALMLRIKDSRRLPGKPGIVPNSCVQVLIHFQGGIQFELLDTLTAINEAKQNATAGIVTPSTAHVKINV